MSELLQWVHPVLAVLGVAVVVLLCLVGIVLSCVSISGTWLVAAAAVLAVALPPAGFPGPWTIAAFLVICVAVELLEAVAAAWGVRRRGGSRLAGGAAVIGGLVGLFVGAWIPVPVVGSLIGMLVCSFGAAFAFEWWRLRRAQDAVGIAWGAVTGRVVVLFMKVAVTLGMMVFLLVGMSTRREADAPRAPAVEPEQVVGMGPDGA